MVDGDTLWLNGENMFPQDVPAALISAVRAMPVGVSAATPVATGTGTGSFRYGPYRSFPKAVLLQWRGGRLKRGGLQTVG